MSVFHGKSIETKVSDSRVQEDWGEKMGREKLALPDMGPDKYITQGVCMNRKIRPIKSFLCHLLPAWSENFQISGSGILLWQPLLLKNPWPFPSFPASCPLTPNLRPALAPGKWSSSSDPKSKIEESHSGVKYKCPSQHPDVSFSVLLGPQLPRYRLYSQLSKGSSRGTDAGSTHTP